MERRNGRRGGRIGTGRRDLLRRMGRRMRMKRRVVVAVVVVVDWEVVDCRRSWTRWRWFWLRRLPSEVAAVVAGRTSSVGLLKLRKRVGMNLLL